MPHTILVGDVGGTNARFALADAQTLELHHAAQLRTADFANIHDAVRRYLDEHATGIPPSHAAIAVACPVGEDFIRLTNNHWQFSARALQQQLGLHELRMLNDFTAQALAIPYLDARDITRIGPDARPRAGEAIAVLGPGTGLGVSGLIPAPDGKWTALSGEGGHVSIAPENEEEIAILRFTWQEFGRSSIERLICGSGIALLYRALAHVRGIDTPPLHEAGIVAQALEDNTSLAHATLMQFCAFLGGYAGDLALILGARGGVYIAGGVVPRFGGLFAASPFRERFEHKGRFRAYTAAIPTYVIAPHDNPALLGAASVFKQP